MDALVRTYLDRIGLAELPGEQQPAPAVDLLVKAALGTVCPHIGDPGALHRHKGVGNDGVGGVHSHGGAVVNEY